MRYENDQLLFSPSDLVVFLDGDFASWMDRWHLEKCRGRKGVANKQGLPLGVTIDGVDCMPDELDDELQLVADKGIAHELAFLRELRNAGHEVVTIDAGGSADAQASRTIDAMRSGAAFIYEGRLVHGEFAGLADFLVRCPGESKLGDYHFEVWDTKLARSLKPYFIVQLCAYSQLLEAVQGRLPASFSVVLGNGQRESLSVRKYLSYFRCLRQSFLNFQRDFAPDGFPDPGLARSHGRWCTFAKSYLESCDHLSRVANITRTQMAKLEAVDVRTLSALATTELRHVPRLAPPLLTRLRTQARLQLASQGMQKPRLEIQRTDHRNPRRGLALLPPESSQDVFFDMEGFPLAVDGLEYLFGLSCCDRGTVRFFDWWAHDLAQEKLAYEGFLDWAYARWQADPSMHIYHYASYEVTALRRLMGKHASRERELDELLRHHVFVDLFTVVRQGLAIGTAGYSLKDIECLYSEPREGGITTAGGSILAYHAWMESRQSQDWRESPLLKVIRDYNQVDCESTGKLAAWLRTLQRENRIQYLPPPPPPAVNDDVPEHPSTLLADRLLREIDEGRLLDPQQAATQRLLAHLLEFHWREAKPVFWAMFARHEMSDQELVDELDCLGRLARTATPPRQVKRSQVYEYQFDPDQDTKLHTGSCCYYAHDLSVTTKIETFDGARGLVEIKLGPKRDVPPDQLSLIPSEYVSADAIATAVFRYVEAWHRGEILSPAVDDLLHRRTPRLQRDYDGPIIPADAELLQASVDAVRSMRQTVLCIQGPPGTGKTYTAAQAILGLLKDGKKVGVTANSHKAILNLLGAVYGAMKEVGEDFRIVKVGDAADDPLVGNKSIVHVPDSNGALAAMGNGAVVMGGTAWLFSRPELQMAFDYLFIDEAGQFSLANTVAVGLTAQNLVLVGDQMQLAQPVLGTHPGDSGQSALNYLLAGHPTIPPHLGIFLDQTWRLHPEICGFISEAVYEGRLRSHLHTASYRLESKGGLVSKEAGILFVPVEHEGNSQGSDDEVHKVGELVEELLRCHVHEGGPVRLRRLTVDDILVVAPFNMQVRLLKNRLGVAARIGSVDKFQGQEAHVVIISMCSSSLQDSPRGAEFLLDPNRLNVAVSRAKTLAIVVGSPQLVTARCETIREMELANLFCWLVKYAQMEV